MTARILRKLTQTAAVFVNGRVFPALRGIPSELDSYSLRKCRNPKKQFGPTAAVNSLAN